MTKQKAFSIEDRIPKLKQLRKQRITRRLAVLISVLIVFLSLLVYWQSPLSKIADIRISGNHLMTKEEVIRQSGLNEGASIWGAGKKKAAQLLKKDDRIKSANVAMVFPNHLNITVTEQKEIAYAFQKGALYPVLETGEILSSQVSGAPKGLPILYGFKEGEALTLFAESMNTLPGEVAGTISEVYFEPKEKNPLHIRAFMTDGFEVAATLTTFAEKMIYYPSISKQLDPAVKGVIDLQVGSYFKAYDPSALKENEEENEAKTAQTQ